MTIAPSGVPTWRAPGRYGLSALELAALVFTAALGGVAMVGWASGLLNAARLSLVAALTTAAAMLLAVVVAASARRLKGSEASFHTRLESQRHVSAALAAVGVSVWEIDPAAGAHVWTGVTPPGPGGAVLAPTGSLEALVGWIHAEDRPTVVSAIEHSVSSGGDLDVEFRQVLPDGVTRWMHATGRSSTDNRSGSTRLVGVSVDVTRRHVLETQLRQSQKVEAVGQLAGGVAHDFNNLLTAILGYSALLREEITDSTALRDLDEIVKAATRATALTRQLLAFSRQQTPEATFLDASEVVDNLLGMLRRLIGEHISLTMALGDHLAVVRINRGQLEQVIVNLVVNARDALPNGGGIRIETANATVGAGTRAHGVEMAPGKYVLLSVSDTGVGMSEDTRARLFEPFFTTKAPGKGTGLGLATVYGIVTGGHGYVSVRSEVGQGATFGVYLPCVADAGRQDAAATDAVARAGDSSRHSVLVVEAEEAVGYLVRATLERAGHRVFEAGTASEAESLAKGVTAVDVLVTDAVLPDGPGSDLYARLRVRYPALRAVIVSGQPAGVVVEHPRMDSGVTVIERPFSADELVDTVAALLEPAEAGR